MKTTSRLFCGQSWEDPEIDMLALEVNPDDRILAVTSGGCSPLTFLSECRDIVVIDSNPAQNFLLELKLLSIRSLSLEQCRSFFGARPAKGRVWTYRTLSHLLSGEARAFWDTHLPLIERGLLHAGIIDRFLGVISHLILRYVHPPIRMRHLFHQKPEDPKRFYAETWNNPRWKKSLRLMFHPMLVRLTRRIFGKWGNVDWPVVIEKSFTQIPVRYNYFLSRAIFGRYLPSERDLPPYLRRAVFDRIKRNSAPFRRTTSDIVDFLEMFPAGSFTKLALSTTLNGIPETRRERAFVAAAKVLSPGGRMVLRHISEVAPVPPGVLLREMKELSDRFTAEERSGIYIRVSVYERLRDTK